MDKAISWIAAALTLEALERALHAMHAAAFLSRVAIIALAAHRIAPSAWRARGDPVELAVVVGPCALLAAQFVCLHRAERLPPGSPPGELRRLKVAGWVLTALILCLLACQVWRDMPAEMVMNYCLALIGFFVFVLCGGQAYQDLDGLGWPRPAVVFFKNKSQEHCHVI